MSDQKQKQTAKERRESRRAAAPDPDSRASRPRPNVVRTQESIGFVQGCEAGVTMLRAQASVLRNNTFMPARRAFFCPILPPPSYASLSMMNHQLTHPFSSMTWNDIALAQWPMNPPTLSGANFIPPPPYQSNAANDSMNPPAVFVVEARTSSHQSSEIQEAIDRADPLVDHLESLNLDPKPDSATSSVPKNANKNPPQ